MNPGRPRESSSPKPDTKRAYTQRSHSPEGGINPYRDKDKRIEPFIDSYKFALPKLTERDSQRQPGEPAPVRRVAVSNREPAVALPSLSIAELTQQCVSAFETCVNHERLMEHQWAENRFADFNLFVDGVGALSVSRVSLDSRLETRPNDLVLIKSVLAMLKDFLVQCIKCTKSQSGTDGAMKKVDTSLENLALIAVASRKTGKRSRLEKADGRFKPKEHTELRDLLRILCSRQHSR